MKSRLLTLKIQRFNPEKDPPRWIEAFHLEPRKGMNLLEVLLRIQDEDDGTLAFRYSCRGAVCGSCAMRVNGEVVLACRTQVERLWGRPILIEPLPFFPVMRDLIVDMSIFFKHYKRVNPYLHGMPVSFHEEYIMEEKERKEIDLFTNCILCGICFGVCPAFKRNPHFLGPAILAKAYRFLADPRDSRMGEILETVDSHNGVWGCNTVFQCVKACPKQVPPTHAIVNMRRKILMYRLSKIFSRLSSLLPHLSLI